MPDVSFPPASARSGFPPPEPATSGAKSFIKLPAWTLDVRSRVTAAIRATLPSSTEARTMTPEPSFWRRESERSRKAWRPKPLTCAAITRTPFTSRTPSRSSWAWEPAALRRRASNCFSRALIWAIWRSRAGIILSSEAFRSPAAERRVASSALVFGQGAIARNGVYAANARGDRLLGEDLENADLARARDVRASAKLLAVEAARARRRREW